MTWLGLHSNKEVDLGRQPVSMDLHGGATADHLHCLCVSPSLDSRSVVSQPGVEAGAFRTCRCPYKSIYRSYDMEMILW